MPEIKNLPPLESLLDAYRTRPGVRDYATHNYRLWRRTRGGLGLVTANRRPFDPRPDYWSMCERRFLVAYFADRFWHRFAPAESLRRLALQVFRHFDAARARGEFGVELDADIQNERWSDLAEALRKTAQELPASADYGALTDLWSKRTLGGGTLSESLEAFLDETLKEGIEAFDTAFWKRITFFPYLDQPSLERLPSAQRFFFGFYSLFASTNAYQHAGSQSFAPLLQNTNYDKLIAFAEEWAKGRMPAETKFEVLGRGAEERDCSHYNTVIELFGFLNLPRGPIFNNAAVSAYAPFRLETDDSPLRGVVRVGEKTRSFMREQPKLVEELLTELANLHDTAEDERVLVLEGIQSTRVAKQRPLDVANQADISLRSELHAAFDAHVASLEPFDRAAALFHILLDAVHLKRGDVPLDVVTNGTSPDAGTGIVVGASRVKPPPQSRIAQTIALPVSLETVAGRALALLRAGFHVLFAGAPGTGKTTLAQLVGHAWNLELDQVPAEISIDAAPRTVVAHSGWATFHTIGGLLPTQDGRYDVQPGLFVTRTSVSSEWELRPAAIVLDEMNRADLDRCIGELYPLLSHSVAQVEPAGLPGVTSIRGSDRFRILATVNDATLDDIVFPISEGLARRFIRLELMGATQPEIVSYLARGDALPDRRAEAELVVAALFEAAGAVPSERQLVTDEDGQHLRFGVAYFAPLRAWVRGILKLDEGELELAEQARAVLILSLRSAARLRGFDAVMKRLSAPVAT